MADSKVDRIRKAVLEQADARQRASNWLLVAAATVEGVGLVLFLVLMDFSNRLHWLIFIAAALVYGTLALTVFSLSEQMKASIQRVLRAIEELGSAEAGLAGVTRGRPR